MYPRMRRYLACASAIVYVRPWPTCCGEFGYGYATVTNLLGLDGSASASCAPLLAHLALS